MQQELWMRQPRVLRRHLRLTRSLGLLLERISFSHPLVDSSGRRHFLFGVLCVALDLPIDDLCLFGALYFGIPCCHAPETSCSAYVFFSPQHLCLAELTALAQLHPRVSVSCPESSRPSGIASSALLSRHRWLLVYPILEMSPES